MTFGDAIEAMKEGHNVSRSGWNGKGMLIYITCFPGFEPCICMKTAQGALQPGWLASQTDILSTDWDIV